MAVKVGSAPGPIAAWMAEPVAENNDAAPSNGAALTTLVLTVALIVAAALWEAGDGFAPRVETVDALAGLTIGAFIVDRLLTFVPPIGAAREVKQRGTDLTVLRFAYGAAIGAVFVVLTDLQAVQALASDSADVGDRVDRVIAVLAIAGGVAGLSQLWAGINPQPETDGTKRGASDAAQADGDPLPMPGPGARACGLVLLGAGVVWARQAIGDTRGVELLGPDVPADDGTVAIIVRFGLVLVAAAIVQQVAQIADRLAPIAKNNKPVILGGLAVLLGVVAAWAFDLYLLHNIGFFGVAEGMGIDEGALTSSSGTELWADMFLTGLVIAAGTKPLHDIAARLRKTAAT